MDYFPSICIDKSELPKVTVCGNLTVVFMPRIDGIQYRFIIRIILWRYSIDITVSPYYKMSGCGILKHQASTIVMNPFFCNPEDLTPTVFLGSFKNPSAIDCKCEVNPFRLRRAKIRLAEVASPFNYKCLLMQSCR